MNKEITNKEKTIDAKLIGFTAVAAILGASFATAMGVSAYGGMMGRGDVDEDQRESVMSAIENNDYDAWKELTDGKRGRMSPSTPEAFEAMAERHDEMEDAIESRDYNTWSELMDGRGRISEVVTEENFDTFVEMHEAMESGDFEKAQELRTELGLGIHSQDGAGYRKGRHGGNGTHDRMNRQNGFHM